MSRENENIDQANPLLDALMIQDPFLASRPSSTTPSGGASDHPQQRTTGSQQQVIAGQRRAVPKRAFAGYLQTAAASKRSAPQDEPGDDDVMQGKDVPTIFKRQRLPARKDPFRGPASPGSAQFVPMHAGVFVLDARALYPNTMSNDRPGLLGAPESAASGTAGESTSNRRAISAGPSSSPLATGRRSPPPCDADESDDGGFRAIFGESDCDADDENGEGAGEGTGEGVGEKNKGKGRAEEPPRRQSPPPRPSQTSTFATQTQVSHMQNDLHEMNHNISRLVNLVDQQTQFFSTLQARGFFERMGGSGGTDSAAGPPPSTSGATAMDVDGPDFAPIPRRPRRGRAQVPKPKGLPTQRDPADVALSDQIRALTRKLMGRKSAKDPLTDEMVPTDQDVEDYDPHNGPCVTVTSFRPDLSLPPSSTWNTCVIEVFVEHFMELHPEAPETRVEELFGGHLKYLCTRWQLGAMDPTGLRSRQRLLNRSERQRNLYYRRLEVAQAYAPLRRHIPMLMALGAKGMSSDESDHRNGVAQYGVFKKEWRHPRITKWLRVFDCLYRRLRKNDVNQNTPGSQPHSRFYANKSSNRHPPVKGLPKNAYNPAWLSALHDYDKRQLLVQEVDYDFSHHKDMLALARDYNGKHNPKGVYF